MANNPKCVHVTKELDALINEFISKGFNTSKEIIKDKISAWQSDNDSDRYPSLEELILWNNTSNKNKTQKSLSNVSKIISGGQTGVDTIGLQVGKKLGIETGGTAPKKFLRERNYDTENIQNYGLLEITDKEQLEYSNRTGKKDSYTARTDLNVKNSDGTVYFSSKEDSMGRMATFRSTKFHNKPFLENPTAEELKEWLQTNNIKTLNVAGNRGSKLDPSNTIASILEEALINTDDLVNNPSYAEDMERISYTFTPITRRNRVTKITRMFGDIVTKLFEEKKAELNNRILNTTNSKEKRELIFELKNLSRFKIIKSTTPRVIFDQIEEIFKTIVDTSTEDNLAIALEDVERRAGDEYTDKQKQFFASILAKNRVAAYTDILNNWRILAEEATSNFSITEGVSMDIADNSIDKSKTSNSLNESGNYENLNMDNSEVSYKDGWMTNVREVSSYSSLTEEVRRLISAIPRQRFNNKTREYEIDRDDLWDDQYLESSYVFAELIQATKNMITSEDLIPDLEKLAKRKAWANIIVSKLKEDPRLFTSFYRVFRKDYLQYGIQKSKIQSDGTIKFQTIGINKSEGTNQYFDEWRDNYEYGIILDSDSLYNNNGEIKVNNAKIGLTKVNDLLGKFIKKSREEISDIVNTEDFIKDLQKVLHMAGITVSDDILLSSINFNLLDAKFANQASIILSNLRTIYTDINKGNEKIVDGNPTDFINIYGTAYNNIAESINNVDEDAVESNVRLSNKNMYAHVNPSFTTTLVKKLKRDSAIDFIEKEYKKVQWFYNEDKETWNNEWLKDLYESKESRNALNHIVLLEYNKKEYAEWTALDATLALINQYDSSPTKNKTGYAYYNLPMLSDSQSAEFLKGKRYIKDYESILLDKFYTLVVQEKERIDLVNRRYNSGTITEIGNLDIRDTEKTKLAGGSEFKFLPELNYELSINSETGQLILGKYDEGKSFLDMWTSDSLTAEDQADYVKNIIQAIMNYRFANASKGWESMGLYDKVIPFDIKTEEDKNKLKKLEEEGKVSYKYFQFKDKKFLDDYLKEYYWNSTFAQSQIIQLLTTDLAYYDGFDNFQKRAKQFHASTEKLNTYATWNVDGVEVPVLEIDPETGKPRKESSIILKDLEKQSDIIEEVEDVINSIPRLDKYEKAAIIGLYKKVNVADAQAYRTLKSFRATQIMANMWSDEEEIAYNNFKNGTWHAEDFTILWNARKPYLYTQENQSDGVSEEGLIKVPVQHKNSEMILLTNAILGTILNSSSKLRALDNFMTDNNIDLAQFESAVKVGKQGVIDINNIDDYTKIKKALSKYVKIPNHIHYYDYNDYGIQVATPEHGIDAVTLVGTQIRRLIGADVNPDNNPDFKYEYNGRYMTEAEWFNYFNAINVANIRESFQSLSDAFIPKIKGLDPINDETKIAKEIIRVNKLISAELLREVRSNPRYGTDLANALTLNTDGDFTIPLNDPSQTLRIQALLNSILKNRVTKQKIQGGALIQVSAYGLERKPEVVFEGEGSSKRLKYVECYLPCPTEELYDYLLDENTHELSLYDSNGNLKVPEKYLEAIGYRIPTEHKYSMVPLKIIGFLPRQAGSIIILPEEITTISGSDFDVDKLYVMFHTLYSINPKAYKDYLKHKNINKKISEDVFNNKDLNIEERFQEWYDENKKDYNEEDSILVIKNFKFDNSVDSNNSMSVYNNVKSQNKNNRDSLMIDLMYAVLTHPSSLENFINPGVFDSQKKSARIITILNLLTIEEFEKRFGSKEELFDKTLEELEDIVNEIKPLVNPIVPDSWVMLHQRNMAGASLIGIAANNNASHAIMQRTKLSVNKDNVIIFNNKLLSSLHEIKDTEGNFITRNISGYLSAFVDNGKDPIAGDLNITTDTADLAFTLLRIGLPINTIGLFLSQPIIKDIYTKFSSESISIKKASDDIISEYAILASKEVKGKSKDYKTYNITNEELIFNILASNNKDINSNNNYENSFYNNQLVLGKVFLNKLLNLSSDLRDLTQATRSDAQGGAVGPSIADTLNKIEKIEQLMNKLTQENFSLSGIDFLKFNSTEEDIINSKLPIQQAFFTYGVESSYDLFGRLFSHYSPIFTDILKEVRTHTKYNYISPKLINKIFNDFISFYLTQFPEFNNTYPITRYNKKTKENETYILSSSDYFINEFPKEFKKFKEHNPNINSYSFINRLKVIPKTDYNPANSIIFNNVGSVTNVQRERYLQDWNTLLYINEETTDIAKKLFIYNTYKGFGFTPQGFGHLAPSGIKLDNKSYIQALRGLGTMNINPKHFVDQFIRNNLFERSIVPSIIGSGLPIKPNTKDFEINLNEYSDYKVRQVAHPYEDGETPVFHEYIHFSSSGQDLYFELVNDGNHTPGKALYRKIIPLGLKNQYIEYDFNNYADTIESIITSGVTSEIDSLNEKVEKEERETYASLERQERLTSLEERFGISNIKEGNSPLDILNNLPSNNTDKLTNDPLCGNGQRGIVL